MIAHAAIASLAFHAAASAAERDVALRLEKGRLADGARTIRVAVGDTLRLRWTSDRQIHLHVHGLDLELRVSPGAPAELVLHATVTGRFPVTVHGPGGRHRAIAYLEIHPR